MGEREGGQKGSRRKWKRDRKMRVGRKGRKESGKVEEMREGEQKKEWEEHRMTALMCLHE